MHWSFLLYCQPYRLAALHARLNIETSHDIILYHVFNAMHTSARPVLPHQKGIRLPDTDRSHNDPAFLNVRPIACRGLLIEVIIKDVVLSVFLFAATGRYRRYVLFSSFTLGRYTGHSHPPQKLSYLPGRYSTILPSDGAFQYACQSNVMILAIVPRDVPVLETWLV